MHICGIPDDDEVALDPVDAEELVEPVPAPPVLDVAVAVAVAPPALEVDCVDPPVPVVVPFELHPSGARTKATPTALHERTDRSMSDSSVSAPTQRQRKRRLGCARAVPLADTVDLPRPSHAREHGSIANSAIAALRCIAGAIADLPRRSHART